MIIDGHVHVSGPRHNDEMLGFSVYDGRLLPVPLLRKSSTPELLIKDMDKFKINKAIVNALVGWATNQQVSDAVKQYHDRLYGFAWVTKRALYLIEPDQQLSINEGRLARTHLIFLPTGAI